MSSAKESITSLVVIDEFRELIDESREQIDEFPEVIQLCHGWDRYLPTECGCPQNRTR